jgi:hypothetical protein
LNTDLFQLDVPVLRIDSYSANVGVWGYYEPVKNKIGVDYMFRKSLFAFGGLGIENFPGNLETELGGYYQLRDFTKVKKTKITLKTEYKGTTYSRNVSGDHVYTRNETVTYIMVPSEQRKYTMLRGGAYFKRVGMTTDFIEDEGFAGPEVIAYSSAGIYAGINFRTITSMFIDAEGYGVNFNSIGKDVYLDVMILPINTFEDTETRESATETIKEAQSALPIGFRLGYKLFQTDKRAKTGKIFGVCGTAELSYKPYLGVCVGAGVGLTLVK